MFHIFVMMSLFFSTHLHSETFTNALLGSQSPYLLQHAHNPVMWYPYGNTPLRLAKEEQKLIFLSIGYSTCHWCHVMEKESFENQNIANLLNKAYISIKVDKEEMPHIDAHYQHLHTLLKKIETDGL